MGTMADACCSCGDGFCRHLDAGSHVVAAVSASGPGCEVWCRIKSYSDRRYCHALDPTVQHHVPNEMAEAVRAKVAAGEYATESEVIRDGLRVLLARDRAVEDWLRKDVAAAYDALKADPSRAVAVGAVKARLAAAHKKVSMKVPTKA